ncbi:MAG: T9SS type A sorting domain-containing protein, partial [Bacteroidales bacterium]|nr:T9SS type A sorting domain-containing protein [Bacteroidales bacterium]
GSTEYMYAIWEPVVDFTFGDLCPGDQIVLPTKNSADVLISGSWEAITGVVSGATYTASGLNDNLTFTPDPSTCAQETDFDVTINTPSVGTSYDYIWKGTSADWNIPTNWYIYNNGYSIATEMPTTDHNIYIGPSQCVKTNWPSQSNEANAKNITIASDATLTVSAGKTLNIAGNLDNIGALVANGTVVFCGETPSQDQTISNNITLANVRFNNRGGAIVPNGSMTITGAATFTNGNVEGDVTFGENSSVENADDMTFYSFVDGTVTKAGNANGFTFPTGQDDVLGKIKVSSNATNVSVRYFHNSDGFDESEYPRWWNVADNCSDNDPRLDHVSNFEYWNVATSAPLSATLTVSAKGGDAHFNEQTVTYDAADIYGAFWNGSCWENVGGGNQSVSEGLHGTISVEVTLPATRSISDKILSLGSIDHNTILPIELTSFSATCDGRSSLVKWTTATEKNNDYFSLERSDDAINFVEIARIAGAGNSIEPLNYNYTDYGVYGGENYYRLVQVDYDGTRTASEIIVVDCVEPDLDEPEVLAYPNPFNSELTLELDNFGNRPASIEVYDVLGRLVSVEKADAPQNRYENILNFSNLSNGTYTVRVSTADFVINRNVVKN